jgi:hypothetical protein
MTRPAGVKPEWAVSTVVIWACNDVASQAFRLDVPRGRPDDATETNVAHSGIYHLRLAGRRAVAQIVVGAQRYEPKCCTILRRLFLSARRCQG